MKQFKTLDAAVDAAIEALEFIREHATINEPDDWDDFKKEEMHHDEAEELKAATQVVEEPKKILSFEDVRAELAEISRNGKKDGIKSLLIKYGVSRLSEVKPEDYENLLTEARKL